MNHERYSDAKNTGCDFHVVKALVEFRSPLRFDDEFEVAVRTSRLGRSSLTFTLGVFLKGAEEASTTGEIIWAYTDQRTHTSVPMAEATRQIVEQFENT